MLRTHCRAAATAMSRVISIPLRTATQKAPLSVYLTQDVAGLGKLGDKIHVKHGFGRNHLIPKGLALYATPENRELMFVRHNIDVEALATADADADAASKQEALSGPKHPFFDAGANVIQRLNWRFRRQAVNAKSESLAVVNPVTKADILAVIRDAKFHHVSAADIVMHPEAEALDHYGAYQFMVRYQAPDYVGWVPVTAGVFPLLDTAMEVNKSLVKKELEEHQEKLAQRSKRREEFRARVQVEGLENVRMDMAMRRRDRDREHDGDGDFRSNGGNRMRATSGSAEHM